MLLISSIVTRCILWNCKRRKEDRKMMITACLIDLFLCIHTFRLYKIFKNIKIHHSSEIDFIFWLVLMPKNRVKYQRKIWYRPMSRRNSNCPSAGSSDGRRKLSFLCWMLILWHLTVIEPMDYSFETTVHQHLIPIDRWLCQTHHFDSFNKWTIK